MNTGDFTSVVQLGVGLHLGTALLQMYGDIGLQPMIRSIDRLKDVADDGDNPPNQDDLDELNDLVSRFGIFKIRMFVEYREKLLINSGVAVALTAILIWMSFYYSSPLNPGWAIAICSVSVLPAPVTLLALWLDASRELKPLITRAAVLEKRMIG